MYVRMNFSTPFAEPIVRRAALFQEVYLYKYLYAYILCVHVKRVWTVYVGACVRKGAIDVCESMLCGGARYVCAREVYALRACEREVYLSRVCVRERYLCCGRVCCAHRCQCGW